MAISMPKYKSYDRIFAKLFNTPWLIEEDWMHSIIEIARREGDMEAVLARMSQPLDETRTAFVRDGVAHIPISGPIFPKANLFTQISGATSIETLAQDFQIALDSGEVNSIILDIDSPGGAVTGVNEFAGIIREASAQKDVTAYVGGTGASAAYWLASAASEIVLDATARVGSIGVVVAYPGSKDDDRIEIVNTASPNKRVDPGTKEGRKVVVKELDALADVFISTVAQNRGTSDDIVRTKFGRGGILVGKDAVDVGMADRLGSFEKLIAEKSNNGGGYMSTASKVAVVTAESLQKDYPAVYDEVFEAGAAQAVSESDEIIKKKDQKIMDLETALADAKTSADTMKDRVAALEKIEMIRSVKEIGASAKAIVDAKLSASSIPSDIHEKIAAMINHQSFVNDGVLDAVAFSASVDAEVKDWEDKLGAASPVQGISTVVKTTSDEKGSAEVDAIVERMLANA